MHNLPLNSNLNLKPVATKDKKITDLSPTRQQKPLQTSSNLLDFLAENQSEHSETAANKKNNSEITEEESIDSENEEDEITTYITKIPDFNGEDIETSPQEWLNQVTKAGDANGWNATRMLRTIPYFLKGTAEKWFETLAAPFNDWNAFKAAFLEQFTDNNTSITLCNCFRNIKQEPSESVITYIGKFNKLLRWICQLETNDYYSDAQILDQFIAGLKDKLIKKVHPHAPEDLNSVIQHAKRYKMAMKETNHTKLVNLAIGETSSAAEKKIDQLTKKVENYFINQQQQRYQPPQRQNQNNFAPLSNNQPQNCHYYCRKLQRDQQNRARPTTNPTAIPTTTHTTLSSTYSKTDYTKSIYTTKLIPSKQQPNYYHTQPSYLTMLEEQDFHHTALSEDRAAAQQQQNPSHNHITIPPQKAITAIYTEAEVEGKPIRLILNSGSAGSIITYQLMQQLKRNTPVEEIDNFPFTLDGITIPVKVLVMDAPQNDWLQKANANLNWKTQELTISYQGQHARVPVICGIFNKCSEKVPAFKFEPEEKKSIIETFMALGSTSNWADKTEQEYFTPHTKPETSGWNISYSKPEPRKQCPYILLKYMLPKECNWIDVAMRGGVCDQTCQYVLSISEKVKRGTPFNAAYNSALNKLYHYPHDAKMIFDLAMALINGATKEDVRQMKEAEYIEYTMELAGFDYKDECPECYALSIPLPSENDENEIKFGEPEKTEEIETTPIYLIENQLALQLKYFNNNGQGIKPEKAHEIDTGYDLRYSGKDTLVLKPKFHTKINLKIALEIPPRAMVQIASWSSLASKEINVRRGIINAGYIGDITVMLQNETDKPVKIEHVEKIAQAIYLPLINISGLQLVNQREQLGKSDRGTQEIGVIHSNIFQQKLPQIIPDFSEIIGHLIPKTNSNPSFENYHVVIEKLSRINMEQLEPQQQTQLKELIAEFTDIFAENNNNLGRTDLVQHQIYTRNAKPRRQQAY
ncbi:hypothetical protein G9A89_004329 [Geosiphon pyriformis]|nr:hypothetical protein G9A89_004329 [Geosiphon pyriformis]